MPDFDLMFAYTLLEGYGWTYDEKGQRYVAPNGETIPRSDFGKLRTDKEFAMAAMQRGGTPFGK